MKVVGYVNGWIDAKNFGFIHENRKGVLFSYFFHRKHLLEGTPVVGSIARFDVVQEPKGAVATNVEIFHSKTEMERADITAALVSTTPSERDVVDVLAGNSTTPSTEVSK